MSRQASPIIPTKWDVLNQPREEYLGPQPEFPGDREQFVYSSPEYQAWLEQASPEFEARRQRKHEWDRAARNAMATGRMTPEQVTQLGYRPDNHEVDTDYSAPPWGKWRPLPERLYHVTTNVPAIASSGVLRSPYELDLRNGRGLGSYGQDSSISFTDSPDQARDIERAMREGADVASGRLPIQRLVEMAESGEGAKQPWLKAMFGTHDWEKGLPQGLHDLLNAKERFYQHKLPEGHPLKDRDKFPIGMTRLPAEEWAKHGFYPDEYSDTHTTADGTQLYGNVHRNLSPQDAAINAFEWWRNPYAPMRSWRGGPSDPLFASPDPQWFANLDPSHIGTIEAQPVPGAHGYPLGALNEWRVPTGEAVNITGINGQPYLPRMSHVKLATPLYKRFVFSPATGQVTLADNTGDPLDVRYHTDLARELNEPNLVHGYAYRLPDGWRLFDWDNKPLSDNFIVAQVMRALQAAQGASGPENGSQDPSGDEEWSRVHHSLPT